MADDDRQGRSSSPASPRGSDGRRQRRMGEREEEVARMARVPSPEERGGGGAVQIQVPGWNGDDRGFKDYRRRVALWDAVTRVPAAQRAATLTA